ncbi:MAG: hypothetical protein NTW50_01340 [Candidatus Berkelbacteria bacterium]|nr:hypothetical protein [Candidatus Berkelbacteria bacterium]
MNCQEITNNIADIRTEFAEFGRVFDAGKAAEALLSQKKIDGKVEWLLDEVDLNQINKRDRIAHKLGLSYLGIFHEDRAWGRFKGGKECVLVTVDGEIISKLSQNYMVTEASDFRDGFAWIEVSMLGDETWYLVDTEGNVVPDLSHQNLEVGKEGIHLVTDWSKDDNALRYSLIKQNGEKISVDGVEDFCHATPFQDGYAWVQEEHTSQFKLVDFAGKVIAIKDLQRATSFSEGKSIAKNIAMNWVIVFTDGRSVETGLTHGQVIGSFHDGITKVSSLSTRSHRYYQLDDRTEKLVPICDDHFEKGNDFSDGLALVSKYYEADKLILSRYCYINTEGEEPFERTVIGGKDFSEGAAAIQDSFHQVSTDGESDGWIYIDKRGKNLFAGDGDDGTKHFFRAEPFESGVALVQDQPNTETYYIDKKGRRVLY